MRCPALFLALLLTACGARSPLDPADRPSNASPDTDAGPGPTCAAVGSPCTSTDDCCNASCDEQLCGGPPCRPGDPPVTLASGQAEPYNIAIDQGAVYFTNLDKAGSVMAVPKRGGSTTTIAADQDHPESVAVDGASVYWTSSGQGFVGRASKDGASQVKLATAQSAPSGIALDASSVYWVNYLTPGSVSAVPKLGGAPAVLATGGTGFSRVAVDDANVTWIDFYGSSVLRVPKGGGAVTTMGVLKGLVSDLVLDGQRVYVAGGTKILRIDAPGSVPQLIAATQGNGAKLALDGDTLYVTDESVGVVSRVPKLGGQLKPIASSQDRPSGVAVDAWCVYWANRGSGPLDGSVMKAPR